jgi:hypothetical protein
VPVPAPLTPADWSQRLAAALGGPVEVRYGRARSSVVSASMDARRRRWSVRLNGMFAHAPEPVQAALVAWMRSGRRARRASTTLDEWIEQELARLHREEPRALTLRTHGRHHDLVPLARELAAVELRDDFAGADELPRITWGRAAPSRSRRSLRLGSYDYAARVVRVHPVLDQPAVPRWFVRFVLFHELLHAVLDEPPRRGRRVLHGPEFRRREQAYRDYARARTWERENIDALIRSARRRVDLPAPAPAAALRSRSRRREQAGSEAATPRSWVQRALFGD